MNHMIIWIRENAAIFSLLGTLIVCAGIVSVSRYQLAGLVAAQAEVRAHINDTTRHIDPQRDSEANKQLIDRLDRIERQIERVNRQQVLIMAGVRRLEQ